MPVPLPQVQVNALLEALLDFQPGAKDERCISKIH